MSFYRKYGKRIFDLCLTIPAFVVLSPVMGVTAVLVAVKLGRPVLFTQKRPGYQEKIFRMYKFRSMTDERDKDGNLLPDEVRLTPFGEKLRSTSLDELPELLNILKGDMSIVGPRPERQQYIDEFCKETPEFIYRLKVKAGLTGYAQIYGKYNTTPLDKLKLDLMYIESYSVLLDMKLIFLTLKIMFTKESTEGVDEGQNHA